MPSSSHVIILVHGIRDYALWQDRIRTVLAENFAVESTNYGRFDLLRFLVPIRYVRDKAIKNVWDQIRDVKKQYPGAKVSFVAHSFGTYIVAKILSQEFDFTAFRVAFCGSVVKYSYPFEQFSNRFTAPILNEVGAKDVWPAIAELVTWGYGSAGTYGFRRPGSGIDGIPVPGTAISSIPGSVDNSGFPFSRTGQSSMVRQILKSRPFG